MCIEAGARNSKSSNVEPNLTFLAFQTMLKYCQNSVQYIGGGEGELLGVSGATRLCRNIGHFAQFG